jgi:NADPH:quinone reductase-like Zn-dependent oxidoreductase
MFSNEEKTKNRLGSIFLLRRKKMKAVVIEQFGGIEEMHWTDLPTPQPAKNEVQIEIAYTSVNPVDWKIREGSLQKIFPSEFPLILGWDAAGTINAIGKGVTKFKVGDEVFTYCRKSVTQWGTYAEYVCVDANHVALRPKKLSFAQAAAFPLVALTAWQALFDHAKLKEGQTVVIHAGAGGVGSIAIEFAKATDAKVYTTASSKNHKYVKSLGADVAIDYNNEDFVDKIHKLESQGVDVVLDCVGGETLDKSFDIVKPGGHLVSIVNKVDENKAKKKKIHPSFMLVTPNGEQLEKIAKWVDEGKIKPIHIQEFPINDYAEALKKSEEGHTQGKNVLRVKK